MDYWRVDEYCNNGNKLGNDDATMASKSERERERKDFKVVYG